MKVAKFGGSSVANASQIKQTNNRIHKADKKKQKNKEPRKADNTDNKFSKFMLKETIKKPKARKTHAQINQRAMSKKRHRKF